MANPRIEELADDETVPTNTTKVDDASDSSDSEAGDSGMP